MSIYLITLADVQQRQPVSVQLAPEMLNPHILSAQRMGLYYVIGKDLYDRIITEVGGGSPSAAVETLMPYVVEYLAYKTAGNLLRLSSYHITGTGVTRKTTTVSEPVSRGDMQDMQGAMESYAAAAEADLIRFITDNQGDYPEYSCMGRASQTMPGMFVAKKPLNPNM